MNFVMLRRIRQMMFEVFGSEGRSEISLRHISRLAVFAAMLILFSSGVVREGVADKLDDDAVWGSVDCGSEELVALYLREFPEGRHAMQARECLARIEEKKGRDDRVEAMLSECRAHHESNRLTRGSVGNALDCYREVLDLNRGVISAHWCN